jgi:hypothetical protein
VHAGNRPAIVVTLAHGAQRYTLCWTTRGSVATKAKAAPSR